MRAPHDHRHRARRFPLFESSTPTVHRTPRIGTGSSQPDGCEPDTRTRQCASCRAKEARYGFRENGRFERPRTLCFDCFMRELDIRRRRAQIAARTVLDLHN